jgi:hypothetical protein
VNFRAATVLGLLVVLTAGAQPPPEIIRDPLYSDVDRAINRAVAYLKKSQGTDGYWTGEADRDHGQTALVTLALLSAGESSQSPAVLRAVEKLKKTEMETTYARALRAAVYAQLPLKLIRPELDADRKWLARIKGFNGIYTYGGPASEGGGDLSNSQYGVLGAWYCAEAGLEVPYEYWSKVESAWLRAASPDGGFGYSPVDGSRSYASMTAAGLATLYLTRDYMHGHEALDLTKITTAPATRPVASRTAKRDPAVVLQRAQNWLGRNFAVEYNAGLDTDLDDLLPAARGATWVHYMLFGYERVGEASGLTHFGSHIWFNDGAKYLVGTQNQDGSWSGSLAGNIDTAYSLLFRSRGRSPVVIQKLQFDGRWDNRTRDVAALIRWLRHQTERHENWQVVSASASPAEMREAPILYAASDQALVLSDNQTQNIKRYIDEGGCFLAVNEGKDTTAFTRSIEGIANSLYPQYTFRDLPKDHPIYTANFATTGFKEPVRALSNGIRELIILLPEGDLSWQWQSKVGLTTSIRPEFSLIGNLLLYLTGSAPPHPKGDSTWIEADASAQTNRTIGVARIKFGGNWDPEPLAWTRLANVMANQNHIRVVDYAITPRSGELERFDLVHLTSTHAFTLPEETRAALRSYMDNGGIVLFDAGGGDESATASFESIVTALYPQAIVDTLPNDHAIYAGMSRIEYRTGAVARLGARLHEARLRGVFLNNKLIAIESPDDLTGALVGYPIGAIAGYSPATATELVEHILLYAADRWLEEVK